MTGSAGAAAGMLRPPSVVRFVIVALLLPAVLAALGLWVNREYRQSEALREQAARSYVRRIDQIMLLSRLEDAEAAVRDFVLTGDPAALEPYAPARQAIRRQLAATIAANDPDVPRGYLPAIRALATRRFADLDRMVALYAGDPPAARRRVLAGAAEPVMDRLRETIGGMIVAEERQSRERTAVFLADRAWLNGLVVAIGAILAAVLGVILLIVWHLHRARHAALVDAFDAAARHATILDTTIDAILIVDADGIVESANAAATRVLGYPPDALRGHGVAMLADPSAPAASASAWSDGIGSRRESAFADQAIRHRDGRTIAADVAVGAMRSGGRDLFVVSIHDISERKRIERAKDDLVSTVSHELRAPLTSIVGALGLLDAGAAGSIPPEAARLVAIAQANSRGLIRLVGDMLDLDRIESGGFAIEPQPIDLRTVVDQACLASEGLFRAHGVAQDCARLADPVRVSGDADRLVQVVTNLMANAIHAAPAGSVVEIGIAIEGARAILHVDDRGPGIPLPFRDRIFARFARAARGGSGTGLGLAISREIVIRHGGTIWFEDRSGGGTRFAFALPIIAAETAAREPDARPIDRGAA